MEVEGGSEEVQSVQNPPAELRSNEYSHFSDGAITFHYHMHPLYSHVFNIYLGNYHFGLTLSNTIANIELRKENFFKIMKCGNRIPPDGFCGYNAFAVLKREIENGTGGLRSIEDLDRFHPVAISLWNQSSSSMCKDNSYYKGLLKRFIEEANLDAKDIEVS